MKTITKHLVKFAVVALISTIVFRYFLSYGIENKSIIITSISSIIHGITLFTSGWFFGKKEGAYLPIYDLGFRFHLITYVIHNSISILWILLGFGSKYENSQSLYTIAMYWGVFLMLHFFYYLWKRKNTIDNLYKEDLFE